jgi:hypothetical protein
MIRSHQFENSSMLSSAEYNDETEELTVTFINGKSYTYIDVPRRTYDELISANSPGKYFNNCKKSLTIKK